MEREEAGRRRELEVAEASVRIHLQQQRAADPGPLPRVDDLAPAPSAPPLRDGPRHHRPVEVAAAPADAEERTHDRPGPAPLRDSPASDAAQPSATALSSPAIDGAA